MIYDAPKILIGLALFVGALTYPLWSGGHAEPEPKLAMPTNGATECVQSKEYMRANHMQVLDEWRHDVVRGQNRVHVSHTGKKFDKSLTKTCLKCHDNKEQFCEKCHTYSSVEPYCWTCHVDSTVAEQGEK